MNRALLEDETRFLERVARYRQEYRSARAAAVNDERERRHANGEVYFAGSWVPRAEAGRIAQAFRRRERLAFFEIVVLLAVLIAITVGMCKLFAFLFLPADSPAPVTRPAGLTQLSLRAASELAAHRGALPGTTEGTDAHGNRTGSKRQ